MDKRISNILNYIESNLGEPHSLKLLAHQTHLSISQFHRLFKKEVGQTPFQFIERIRLTKALKLLSSSDAEVLEIALKLGYKNYETFSRAFKKKHLISPDDLRAIFKEIGTTDLKFNKGRIIISACSSENEEQLLGLAQNIVEEQQISREDLQGAKIFRISSGPDSSSPDNINIRNKFNLKEDSSIWKFLIYSQQ